MKYSYSSCYCDYRKKREVMRMERFVADERTGLKYELVGDYYLIAGDKPLPDIGKQNV